MFGQLATMQLVFKGVMLAEEIYPFPWIERDNPGEVGGVWDWTVNMHMTLGKVDDVADIQERGNMRLTLVDNKK